MRQLLSSAGVVKLRVNREYNRFKYRLMKMKEEVFQFLLKQKDILYQLWERFIKWEQLSYSTWEQIDDLISF